MGQKVILADDQPVFRAGLARFLAVEDDFTLIGQCDDLPRLYKAIHNFPGAIVSFSTSLAPDLTLLGAAAITSKLRLIAVLNPLEKPQQYVRNHVQGILYRHVSRQELLKCFRTVAKGGSYIQEPSKSSGQDLDNDLVGQRARDRLTPKELKIIALLLRGYKNRDIALELKNSEQVIKNYLRSIFDKTGVAGRLELALFTLHHGLLQEPMTYSNNSMPPPPPAGPLPKLKRVSL